MKAPVLADPRFWGWLAIALAAGVLLYVLSPILAPFLAGAILAYVLNPLVDRLTGRYLPRIVAVVLVLLFAKRSFSHGANCRRSSPGSTSSSHRG